MQQPSTGWVDSEGKRWFRNTRDAVWSCRGLGPSAKLVALRLVEYGADAFPAIGTLADWCELSERTVRSALRALEKRKVITTRRTGRSSRYSLFCNVRIPELGTAASPPADDAPDSGVAPVGASPDRQILPIRSEESRSANFADQIGNGCRSDRQPLPPKQGGKLKSKRGGGARERAKATPPPLFFDFEGWECSPELRAELIQLGIPSERLDYRLKRLKNRVVNRGAGVRSLDNYVRENAAEFWVGWEAERLAKANSSGGNAVSSGFGGGGAPGAGLMWEPAPRAGLGPYCKRWKLDLGAEAAEFKRRGEPVRRGGGAAADTAFKDWLVRRAKEEDQKRKAADAAKEKAA